VSTAAEAKRLANSDSGQGGGPTKIVFITGMGRSGSTLLELLLGRIEGWVAGGELRRYWHGDSFSDWVCGCGRLLAECDFWGTVRQDLADAGLSPGEYPGFLELQAAYLRLRPGPLARLVAGARHSPRPDSPLHRYQLAMSTLGGAVANAAGARVVVDSSKEPTDAYLASWNAGVDLSVVHLVRDPRAVAHSFSKRIPEPQPDFEYMPQSSPFGTAVRWDLRQGLCEGMLRPRLRERYMRMRYEDLVRDPASAVRSVARFAGEPDPDLGFLSNGRVAFERTHTVSGNPFRLRQAPIEINPDEAWRTSMTRRQKALAAAPALPLLRRYGYRWQAE
jgi:sulfotransferase family protein